EIRLLDIFSSRQAPLGALFLLRNSGTGPAFGSEETHRESTVVSSPLATRAHPPLQNLSLNERSFTCLFILTTAFAPSGAFLTDSELHLDFARVPAVLCPARSRSFSGVSNPDNLLCKDESLHNEVFGAVLPSARCLCLGRGRWALIYWTRNDAWADNFAQCLPTSFRICFISFANCGHLSWKWCNARCNLRLPRCQPPFWRSLLVRCTRL